jgi:hypothetical protein
MRSRSDCASATALAVDGQHAVALAQPGRGGRAAGLDLAQHRLAEGAGQADTLHQPRVDVARAQAAEVEPRTRARRGRRSR